MQAQKDKERQIIADLTKSLFPLMRSITGEGQRQTYRILEEYCPLKISSFSSGAEVFDWTIPKEWVYRQAWVKDAAGNVVIDASKNNLHILNYSEKFSGKMELKQLVEHLFTDPKQPAAIPYVTSYYKRQWGFCISENQKAALKNDVYEVFIDTDLVDGELQIAEARIPGRTTKELMFSTYVCHPSMVNDELCGAMALVLLYQRLRRAPQLNHRVTFLFIPETIGSLCYLKLRGEELKRSLVGGINLSNIAHRVPFEFKRSRRGSSKIDSAMVSLLREGEEIFSRNALIKDFEPLGSDERQFCAPGFDLAMGALTRGPADFEGYHSSADSLERMDVDAILETVDLLERCVFLAEESRSYLNLKQHGEPMLGKYQLYPQTGGANHKQDVVLASLWILNLSDGNHDLLDISHRSGLKLALLNETARLLESAGLIKAEPMI